VAQKHRAGAAQDSKTEKDMSARNADKKEPPATYHSSPWLGKRGRRCTRSHLNHLSAWTNRSSAWTAFSKTFGLH
jgi:hypothetical protein